MQRSIALMQLEDSKLYNHCQYTTLSVLQLVHGTVSFNTCYNSDRTSRASSIDSHTLLNIQYLYCRIQMDKCTRFQHYHAEQCLFLSTSLTAQCQHCSAIQATIAPHQLTKMTAPPSSFLQTQQLSAILMGLACCFRCRCAACYQARNMSIRLTVKMIGENRIRDHTSIRKIKTANSICLRVENAYPFTRAHTHILTYTTPIQSLAYSVSEKKNLTVYSLYIARQSGRKQNKEDVLT